MYVKYCTIYSYICKYIHSPLTDYVCENVWEHILKTPETSVIIEVYFAWIQAYMYVHRCIHMNNSILFVLYTYIIHICIYIYYTYIYIFIQSCFLRIYLYTSIQFTYAYIYVYIYIYIYVKREREREGGRKLSCTHIYACMHRIPLLNIRCDGNTDSKHWCDLPKRALTRAQHVFFWYFPQYESFWYFEWK